MSKKKGRVFGAQTANDPNGIEENLISLKNIEEEIEQNSQTSDGHSNDEEEGNMHEVYELHDTGSIGESVAKHRILSDDEPRACPICMSFEGDLRQIERHLDHVHLRETEQTQYKYSNKQTKDRIDHNLPKQYDSDAELEEVKEAIFGFFRKAGSKVRGFGDTLTKGKFSNELGRLGVAVGGYDDQMGRTIGLGGEVSASGTVEDCERDNINYQRSFSDTTKCSYEDCLVEVSLKSSKISCKRCTNTYCSEHQKMQKCINENGRLEDLCLNCIDVSFGSQEKEPAIRLCVVHTKTLEQNVASELSKMSRRASGMKFYKNSLHELEKTVVGWENDQEVTKCRICSWSEHPSENLKLLGWDYTKPCLYSLNVCRSKDRRNPTTGQPIEEKSPAFDESDGFNETLLDFSNSFTHKPRKSTHSEPSTTRNSSPNITRLSISSNTSSSELNNNLLQPPGAKLGGGGTSTNVARSSGESNKDINQPQQPEANSNDCIHTRSLSIPRDELLERLSVLREQRVVVQGYIRGANNRREWSDAQTLHESLEDLDMEISAMEKLL
ncbi:hypothetical protein AX774_g2174 [Zancudomyces culisetae]|uniref:Rabenosyn Rab binding domain-containing protein n=1 Tax=Zancudomyces culisetae TaxID=1213189 RepID=A0A1R1PTP7_ZANCU|nr:hypothetical protein AX774_g2174 [Zancudomyces culisetae]|eukprot:OMH84299.1 hypothetical protein AX774_g2174 [Zancudomyces culisetae]